MSLKAAVGLSTRPDSLSAAGEALAAVKKGLAGKKPSIVFAFASYQAFDHKALLGELKKGLAGVPLVGSTTAGEIFNRQSLDNSLVLLALASETISFYPCVVEGVVKNPREAATSLADKIRKNQPDLKLLLIAGSAFAVQGDIILEALGGSFSSDLPVVGGNAGDDLTLKGGLVFLDDRVYTDALLGVAVAGDFHLGVGIAYGWKPIGVDLKITKMTGNRIYEINNRPARKIYEDYFGERVKELIDPSRVLSLLYPLGRERPDYPECLIRTPVIFYPDGSIEMGGAFSEGDKVRLMLGDTESIVGAAGQSARMAKEGLGSAPAKAALVFDCISRKRILREEGRLREVGLIAEEFGPQTPVVGFYTYGEYAPWGSVGCYHNQSLVTLALGG